MKKLTHKDFENYDTSKSDIIVAVVFIVVSMACMLYWSQITDKMVIRELSKPINYEEVEK